jgi:hypothetical protein
MDSRRAIALTVASVTTDTAIGPFVIPSNAQNMIMNSFAQRQNKKIEIVIPEPILSDELLTTQWLHQEFQFTALFLTSIHQLPRNQKSLKVLCDNMSDTEFFFAIEGERGIGEKFLRSCAMERDIFSNAEVISQTSADWLFFYRSSKA